MPNHPSPADATGLRHKTGLLLLAITLAVLLMSLAIGQRVMRDLAGDLSRKLAVAEAKLTKEKIEALVGRQLAVSRCFANMRGLRDWLRAEQNPEARARFLAEAEGFRPAFSDVSYFIVSDATLAYHYADAGTAFEPRLRYTLDPQKADDAWYFATMSNAAPFTLNVNPDAVLQVTNLWINVKVTDDEGHAIGLTGTGLRLDHFLKTMLAPHTDGVTSYVVDVQGRIVAHPDPARIQYGAMGIQDTSRTVFADLVRDEDRQSLSRTLTDVMRHESGAVTVETLTRAGDRIIALTSLPELRWIVVSNVDPAAKGILSTDFLRLLLLGGGALVALVILALTLGFDHLVLRPLLKLTESARRIAMGRYDTRLDSDRSDEIGTLSRAFDTMAAQIQAHTEDLEQRVAERTAQLEATHSELAATHRQLTESIRYASLIQKVILPDRQLETSLQGQYFVVWQPRDVVGGDFYLFREQEDGCLFGVVDCAGHGVPGAFMTMIAHAALERATLELGLGNPADLLERADQAVRQMLPDTDRLERLATSMDIGLCHVDWKEGKIRFSGAHIDLFTVHAGAITAYRGDRGGINDRKRRSFTQVTLDLEPDSVFYLVTDGILDQSGGERGLPFGRSGFTAWLTNHSALPLEKQKTALTAALTGYRGDRPQRDDITVLAFRFAPTSRPEEDHP